MDGLHSIPWDSKGNDTVALLVPHTIEVNAILLLKFHQHGCYDVSGKRQMEGTILCFGSLHTGQGKFFAESLSLIMSSVASLQFIYHIK